MKNKNRKFRLAKAIEIWQSRPYGRIEFAALPVEKRRAKYINFVNHEFRQLEKAVIADMFKQAFPRETPQEREAQWKICGLLCRAQREVKRLKNTLRGLRSAVKRRTNKEDKARKI